MKEIIRSSGKPDSKSSMDKITETNPISASGCGRAPRLNVHPLVEDLSETAKLALPMIVTQVGQITMMATDIGFIGRIGDEALAAAALAGRIYLISFSFGAGLLAPIVPLAAQAFATGSLTVVRLSLRTGLWAALLLSFPIMAFALGGEEILLGLHQTPDTARLAQQYLFGLAWGVAPALCFQATRNLMGALNRPEPVLWITLVAIPFNAALVYLLIYGKLGLPRLELFGAGLATTLVNCGTCLAGLWFAKMRPPFRDYHLFAHLGTFEWPLMRQLIVIGTPISIALLMGYGLISAAALLAGVISNSALAAHQIAVQIATILYVIPFGISMAAAVRVGYAAARNDSVGVKRAGFAAMLLGILIVALLSLAIIAARFEIAELFRGEPVGDADATSGLAAKLLLVGAGLFIADAAQTIMVGGLRGLKDARVPFLLSGIGYWLVGFPLSYVLGVTIGLGVIGIWIGLSIGTSICAVLSILRFQLVANRLVLKADV